MASLSTMAHFLRNAQIGNGSVLGGSDQLKRLRLMVLMTASRCETAVAATIKCTTRLFPQAVGIVPFPLV
jgi:hypothetical protein